MRPSNGSTLASRYVVASRRTGPGCKLPRSLVCAARPFFGVARVVHVLRERLPRRLSLVKPAESLAVL